MNGIRIRFETKPGKSFASRGRLPELARELDDRRRGLVRRRRRADHLDQRHHGHGVEEVHADHPVGPAGHRRERRDRDRRRVRREDRLRGQHLRRPAGRSPPSQPHPRRPPRSSDRPERDRPPARRARAPRPARGPPFSASFSRLFRIAASPRSTAPGAASYSDTCRPDAATTCAMPPPIWPAPTTRTCSKLAEARPRAAARRPGRRRSRSRRARARRPRGAARRSASKRIRAPDAPIGWPSATAPPFTLTVSGSALEHARRVERDRAERLVHLDALDVADRLARLLERDLPRAGRRPREIGELVRDVALRDDRRERPRARALRELLAGDDERAGAVVDARARSRRWSSPPGRTRASARRASRASCRAAGSRPP